MWKEIRRLFPIHRSCVYLNNAGVCPPSLRVLEAVESFHRTHALYGWKKVRPLFRDAGRKIKGILSRLLGCDPSLIALVHNTSEGMNIVAQGLDWKAGDVVVGLDREYPANVYPWWNLASSGVRYVRLPQSRTHRDVEALQKQVETGARLVAVSAVDWCTGYVYDLRNLGAACRRNGAVLVVDGAQALGTVPVDLEACGIYALAASAWKGLMGPVGLGVFVCSPELLEKLSLRFVGTDTVEDAGNYLDYRLVPRSGASRFEFSTPNANDWMYLAASLELLDEIGFETVRKRLLALTSVLREEVSRKGYVVAGSATEGDRSSIVSFRKEGIDARQKAAALAARNILVVERDGFIRASPHIYNDETDLGRLIEEL